MSSTSAEHRDRMSPRGKALRLLSELGAKRAAFPKERRFYLKEYLLRIEYIWQTFSRKKKKKTKNKVSPSIQGKQQHLSSMIKCEVSAENQNFGKPRVRYFEFVSFLTLKRLLVKIIIKMIF